MWLNKFEISEHKYIYARFKDAGSLSEGVNVLYRGVKAGTVDGVELSEDEQYAMVKIRIRDKKLKIYQDDVALIFDKGFTGNKVISIIPSENKTNKIPVKDGGVIQGDPSFTIEELEKVLTQMNNEGSLDIMLLNIAQLLENTTVLSHKVDKLLVRVENLLSDKNTKQINKLLDDMTILAINLNTTSIRVNKILGDNTVGKDLKSTLANSKEAMSKLNVITDKADKLVDKSSTTVTNLDSTIGNVNNTVTNIDNTLNNPELTGSVKNSLNKMSDVLTNVQKMTNEGDIKINIQGPVTESLKELEGLGCFTKELGKTLSKGFLIPRLFLGNPGRNLKHCSDSKNCEEQNNQKK